MSYRETFRMNQRDFNEEKFDQNLEKLQFDIKAKHESGLYKLVTEISEDLRDTKGYSEYEIKTYLLKFVEETVSES